MSKNRNNKISIIISILVMLYGFMVTASWLLNILLLKAIDPILLSLPFKASLCFFMSGIILFVYSRKLEGAHIDMGEIILPVCLTIICLTTFGNLFNSLFFIELDLFSLLHKGSSTSFIQKTMNDPQIMTMGAFCLIAYAAFVNLNTLFPPVRRLSRLGKVLVIIGIIALIGHLFNIPILFYSFPGISGKMSLQSSLFFTLIGIGFSKVRRISFAKVSYQKLSLKFKMITTTLLVSLICYSFFGSVISNEQNNYRNETTLEGINSNIKLIKISLNNLAKDIPINCLENKANCNQEHSSILVSLKEQYQIGFFKHYQLSFLDENLNPFWFSPNNTTINFDKLTVQKIKYAKYYEGLHNDINNQIVILGISALKSNSKIIYVRLFEFEKTVLIKNKELFFNTLLLIFLIMIVVGIVAYPFINSFVKPIEIFTRSFKNMSKGNLSIKLSVNRADEIGQMYQQFNKLAESLRQKTVSIKEMTREMLRRKKTEKQLQALNHELEDYAYAVSHDLKAPMRGINNLAEWIYEDEFEKLSEEGKENLVLLKQRASQMQFLIQDILSYSRIGRVEADKVKINLEEFARGITKDIAIPENFTLEFDLADAEIVFDKTQLSQVLQNILSNSIKFMDNSQPRIKVSSYQTKKEIIITITDNGPGIDPKYHEKIFRMFEIGGTSHSDSTGIGLSIVKKIMNTNKGRVWVESEVGKGASFCLAFRK